MDDSATFERFDLNGQVSIITGGSMNLGFDMACALAAAGSDIVLTSRKYARAKVAAERMNETYGVDTLPIEMDQRHYQQVAIMASKVMNWKGHVNILMNNAGGGSGQSEGNLFKRTPEAIMDLITVNLIGPLFCCREIGRIMIDQGFGKIINIASVSGMIGRDRRMYRESGVNEHPLDYAAAKAGIIGMTKDLAGLLSPHGIHVNAIPPGGFDKGTLPDQFVEEYVADTPLGRMGRIG
ncbi:MAG: SDR family NAD(P)-dependent oxidoreductase [Planctomycetota bacterium]|jgi:NAD(P)-dependent dehydrogenase (short-subunit alcohol dehydrogenase family)